MLTNPPTHPLTPMQALKARTRDCHDAAERQIPFSRWLGDRRDYAFMLRRLLGIYRGVGEALAGVDLRDAPIPADQEPRRARLLADLEDLGASAADVPSANTFPVVRERAAACGMLYVIEGAALGQQLLYRTAAEELGCRPDWAGRFLAGDVDIGPRWRRFSEWVDAALSIADADRDVEKAVGAARATFQGFTEWMLADE